MSKAVLISIKPEWCAKIANGKKSVEIRKTKPNLYVPFKVYIYCTNQKLLFTPKQDHNFYATAAKCAENVLKETECDILNGKVIGEFVCNNICEIDPDHAIEAVISEESCVSPRDMHEYLGVKTGYGWRISDLRIYDQPKELSEFAGLRKTKFGMEPVAVMRPPQSWCYVEEQTWND